MRRDFSLKNQVEHKCVIITGAPSLGFLENILSNPGFNLQLICYCCREEQAENIPVASQYEIIADLSNDDINNIITKLLNRLMQFDCDINVKVFELPAAGGPNIESCMRLLGKLDGNKLIRLDILNDSTQTDIKSLTVKPIENVTCFIGPGNTGKTSIISSVSELFFSRKQRVALLDLTAEQKLAGYIPYSADISDICFENNTTTHCDLEYDDDVSLYTYTRPAIISRRETVFLMKAVKHLSIYYDFVLINADTQVMNEFIEVFKLCSKIFVVQDCVLNKINSTHKMLLDLHEAGIDTLKTVSMIYNKVIKKASDMAMIEENIIFEEDARGHLIPLIDIHCNTLEIFYSKQTVAALNNKFIAKDNTVHDASINYIKNMNKLYKIINNLKGCEYTDMKFTEFASYHLNNFIHNYFLANIKLVLTYLERKKHILPKENMV